MNQNLETLALFAEQNIRNFGKMENKLTITSSGKFERVSGLSGSFSRTFSTTDQSFTSKRIQDYIYSEIKRELDKIKDGDAINTTTMDTVNLCVRAFKGYLQIAMGYIKRKDKGEKIDDKLIQDTYSKLNQEIRRKIKNIILHKNIINVVFPDYQRTFLKDYVVPNQPNKKIDLVNGGICWGISAKWCTRWLSGKKGFTARKTKYVISPLFSDDFGDTYNTPDDVRFLKKSTEMFTLMHHQNLFLKTGGFVGDGMKMFNSGLMDNYKVLGGAKGEKTPLSYNQATRKVFSQSPPRDSEDASARDFIARKKAKYDKIKLDLQEKISDHVVKGQSYKYVGPTTEIVKQTAVDFFKKTEKHKADSSFMIYWMTDGKGGHALSAAFDQTSNNWFFMDPNYGEWCGDQVKISNIFQLIISLYSFDFEPIWYSIQRMHVTP